MQTGRSLRSRISFHRSNMNRKYLFLGILFIPFLGILVFWGVWKWGDLVGTREQNENPLEFSGELAYNLAKHQADLGPRVPGSDSHRKTGDWIIDTFRLNNW